MIIRKKSDIQEFLGDFKSFASSDNEGEKEYFVFVDKFRKGLMTLMRYPDGTFTCHGKGAGYSDEDEQYLTPIQLQSFVWKHRSAINNKIR